MYVMLNDGGVLSSDPSSSVANGILLQRVAILELMTQGLSCTLLFGVEFRDSKVSRESYRSSDSDEPYHRSFPLFWTNDWTVNSALV